MISECGRCRINTNQPIKTVCGSDGHTYRHQCQLSRMACLKGIDIQAVPDENCMESKDNLAKRDIKWGGLVSISYDDSDSDSDSNESDEDNPPHRPSTASATPSKPTTQTATPSTTTKNTPSPQPQTTTDSPIVVTQWTTQLEITTAVDELTTPSGRGDNR